MNPLSREHRKRSSVFQAVRLFDSESRGERGPCSLVQLCDIHSLGRELADGHSQISINTQVS